jgi:uncharacterized membrane protein
VAAAPARQGVRIPRGEEARVDRIPLLRTSAGRVAGAVVLGLALGVVAAVVALWPRADIPELRNVVGGEADQADVVRVTTGTCESYAGPGCKLAEIRLRSGPNAGERSYVSLPGDRFAPILRSGDHIRVARNAPFGIDPSLVDRLPIDDPSQTPYAFIDFERVGSIGWLALAFALLVLLLGRFQGARSLLGLAGSLVLVVAFVVPAILEGRPALLVAIVGSLAVMLLTIGLTHGVGLKSVAAILGTTAALALTAVIALLWVRVAHITGFSSEGSELLNFTTGSRVSLEGLVLAGMVIAALGVLDDVTVSQASTVLALRRADPGMNTTHLFAEGMSVGRDHLSATVNTLVLAYVGAALPVLLIFSSQGTSLTEAVNREVVATEVVSMLVGSLGLIAAVPLTTALAALLAARVPPEALPEDVHDHAH